MLHQGVLFWLTNLLLLQMGSTVAQSCNAQTQSCSRSERVLGHRNSSINLICGYPLGGLPVVRVEWFHLSHSSESQRISIEKGTSRYGGRELHELDISHAMPEDEGVYECDVTRSDGNVELASQTRNGGCVLVLGTAVFSSCNARTCPREEIAVQAGDSITFDTRITFINSGSCDIPQDTTFLKLLKGDEVLYSCNTDRCNPASMDGSIQAVSSGNHKFNMNLAKAGAVMEDGGEYEVRVEVVNPRGTPTREILTKRFNVTVEENVMTPPSSTPTVSTGSPTIGSTQPSSTTDSVTISAGTDMPDDSTMTTSLSTATPSVAAVKSPTGTVQIIAPVVSVVALIAICIAAVIIAVFRKKSRCTCSCSDLETVTDCGHIGKTFISNSTTDYHGSEVTVCMSTQRPESMFLKDLGNFELEDKTPVEDQDGFQKKNSVCSDI